MYNMYKNCSLFFFHRMLYAVVFALLATSTLAACKCQHPVFSTMSHVFL